MFVSWESYRDHHKYTSSVFALGMSLAYFVFESCKRQRFRASGFRWRGFDLIRSGCSFLPGKIGFRV